jgi:CheY-like chemotaxis protein
MNRDLILYVEDDENDAFLLECAFRKAEISNPLLILEDGGAAIEYLSGNGRYASREEFELPGLVLLDLNMPGTSGLEILKWIRTTPSVSTLPVIVLTSSNRDGDVHRSYQQGANGYLIKPSNLNEMISMARAIKDFWLLHNRRMVSVGAALDEGPPG